MSDNAVDTNTRSNNRTKVFVSVLAFIGICVPLIWGALHRPKLRVQSLAPQYTAYSGRIAGEDGKPIAGADVIATQNQELGENFISDVNGQFQVRIGSATVSLRLAVNAVGFIPIELQARLNRTGPEEIVLHPLPKVVVDAGSAKTMAINHKLPTVAPAPVAVPAPTPTPSQTVNNDHGIGGIGGTYINPTVIDHPVYGSPEPLPNIIRFQAVPLGPEKPGDFFDEGDMGSLPGVEAGFSLDRDFAHPMFLITCDKPCTATDAVQQGANQGGVVRGYTGNPKVAVITIRQSLFQGARVYIRLRGSETFNVLAVAAYQPMR